MSSQLPAHVLLVRFVVILAPLTALLAIMCAVWPAARWRLAWLVLGLAVITAVLTPLTTEAGEWLEHRVGRTPLLQVHTELGDTMLYFSLALVVAAVLIAVILVREVRGDSVKPVVRWLITAFVVIASILTTVQVFRIGDSGAKATWGQEVATGSPARETPLISGTNATAAGTSDITRQGL